MIKGDIKRISYQTAVGFLLPIHYSGRIPSISFAFGWYINNNIVAVCTLGKPASNPLCVGICGEKHKKNVIELNRLCRVENFKSPLSYFVGKVLKKLKKFNLIVVSYSDTAMNHTGYIYQSTNFIYTGKTKKRTDKFTEGNKHPRHYNNNNQKGLRKIRSSKHRYVYFCTSNKKLKKEWMEDLNYSILPYPKTPNKNYIPGDYLKPEIIHRENINIETNQAKKKQLHLF